MTFLVDVDDTLLDNDRFRDDVQAELVTSYGDEIAGRYWAIQERRFVELEYRDYLGAVQEWWEGEGRDSRLLGAARFLLDYPFAERLYPGALDALAHLRTRGPTVVVTDGDARVPAAQGRAGAGSQRRSTITSSSTSTRSSHSTTWSVAIRPTATSSWTTSSGS